MLNYQPLCPNLPHFRLLTLKSRAFVDGVVTEDRADSLHEKPAIQVYCKLSNAFRNPVPEYIAVSYQWNPERAEQESVNEEVTIEDVPIIVNNTIVDIRPNLEALLRHLQEPQKDVTLWADALCINQDDQKEKSTQIPEMGSIYAEAANTIIWLGAGDDASNVTIEMLDALGKDLCEMNAIEAFVEMVKLSNNENKDLYTESSARVGRLMEGPLRVHERNALQLMVGFQKLCRLPYWRRTWILQEFALSANIEIRQCTAIILFDRLRACMMFIPLLQQHIQTRLAEVISGGGESLYGEPILGRWISEFFQPLTVRTQGVFGFRVRHHGQSGNPHHERQPLIEHLVRAHVIETDPDRSICKEPSDKVYGLLGLAADTEELMDIGMKVDCEKSSSLIYTEAARAMISRGHLDVLSYCQFPKSDPEMPSWVPDWRMPIRWPCGGHAWDTAFEASGDTRFQWVTENQDIFSVTIGGVRVDTIECFRDIWDPGLPGISLRARNHNKISKYLDDIKALCEESALKNTSIYVNSADRDEAYYRIPIADQEVTERGFRRQATADCFQGYCRVQEDLKASAVRGDNWHISKVSYFDIMEAMHRRRPFVSAEGYVGLGPANLQVGDVVCLFLGAKLPYVLRQSGISAWTLVGEAYVHGIMYGEFITDGLQTELFNIK